MFDFFEQILGNVAMVIDYFIGLVHSLISFVGVLAGAVVLPQTLIGYMPALLGTAVLSVISVGVVKMIIGR